MLAVLCKIPRIIQARKHGSITEQMSTRNAQTDDPLQTWRGTQGHPMTQKITHARKRSVQMAPMFSLYVPITTNSITAIYSSVVAL